MSLQWEERRGQLYLQPSREEIKEFKGQGCVLFLIKKASLSISVGEVWLGALPKERDTE